MGRYMNIGSEAEEHREQERRHSGFNVNNNLLSVSP